MTTDIGEAATVENVLPTKAEVLAKIKDAKKQHPNETPVLVSTFDGAFEPTRAEESSRRGTRGKGEWKEVKGFRIYRAHSPILYA